MTGTEQVSHVSEASLEARLARFLLASFPDPALDIDHQPTFTIRLGHTDHVVGTKQTWAGGRADILVTSAKRPLAVIELKAPDESIDEDAKHQALSYARLVEPMAPLAIVTNGTQTLTFRSFDGVEIKNHTFDETAVTVIFTDAALLAAASYDDAVRDLLARDDTAFATLLRSASHRTLQQMTGDVKDLARPLSSNFSVPRSAADEIADSVRTGNRLTLLVGPALSGRTNVLAQFCKRDDVVPIFIDGVAAVHGPIRFMANVIGARLFRATNYDTVRQWLRHRLQQKGANPLAIVVDGWGAATGERTRQDVAELLQLCDENGIALVAAIDDAWFDSLSITSSGQASAIGRGVTRIELSPLSGLEFEAAAKLIADDFNLAFDRGSEFNADYRQPRILRLILASKPDGLPPIVDAERGLMTIFRAPTVTTPILLDGAWDRVASAGMRDDFLRYARAVMADEPAGRSDPHSVLLGYGLGTLSLQAAETSLGDARIKRLIESGLVSYLSTPNGDRFLYPRVPEILAKAAGIAIARDAVAAKRESLDDLASLYETYISRCDGLPLPDVVGASALQEIFRRSSALLGRLVKMLWDDKPKLTELGDGASVLIQLPGGAVEEAVIPGGPALGNLLPYLILSQIAAQPMAAETDGDVNVGITVKVGSCPHILLRADPRLQEALGIETHDLPGGVSIVCPGSGVIEPLTNSIIMFLRDPRLRLKAPGFMEQMAKHAADESNLPLGFRLWTAFGVLGTSTDEVVGAAARHVRTNVLGPLMNQALADIHPTRS
ncbi:MAG: type I restriction enzyme HsdR N-terminal domain-containing protein [Pseudomonadota bacterium]